MTPQEHATAAAADIATAAQPHLAKPGIADNYARRAQVHAVLSKSAGTGDNFAAADALLTTSHAANTFVGVERAHALALMAEVA